VVFLVARTGKPMPALAEPGAELVLVVRTISVVVPPHPAITALAHSSAIDEDQLRQRIGLGQ
jgi:hypothetical protein